MLKQPATQILFFFGHNEHVSHESVAWENQCSSASAVRVCSYCTWVLPLTLPAQAPYYPKQVAKPHQAILAKIDFWTKTGHPARPEDWDERVWLVRLLVKFCALPWPTGQSWVIHPETRRRYDFRAGTLLLLFDTPRHLQVRLEAQRWLANNCVRGAERFW